MTLSPACQLLTGGAVLLLANQLACQPRYPPCWQPTTAVYDLGNIPDWPGALSGVSSPAFLERMRLGKLQHAAKQVTCFLDCLITSLSPRSSPACCQIVEMPLFCWPASKMRCSFNQLLMLTIRKPQSPPVGQSDRSGVIALTVVCLSSTLLESFASVL